jgi:competence protein ComEA
MLAWLERNSYLTIALDGFLLLAGLLAREALRSEEAPVLLIHDGAVQPGTPIKVHVAGAVFSPGVYTLAAGDRVEDAVAAAGGATDGADLESVNLARRLRDGEQIRIEGPGVQAAPFVPGEQLLDLNSATREQLMALPGIGEAYSQRIVASRAADGLFTSVDDVLQRGLVPERTFEGIRTLVTVSTP